MQNPERFTIIVDPNQKPDVVLRKVRALLKELDLDETSYRVYMDGNIKTVINVIIDELFSEEFILEALNRQIRFVATNEKIRRIMALVSSDTEEESANEMDWGKKRDKSSQIQEIEEEISEFETVDSSTVKFAEMLNSDEPDKAVDEAESLIDLGEEIVKRAKDVLVTTVENEIKKAVKSTLNNPRNLTKSLKVLKDLLCNKTLNYGEFKELSQKAGFNAIKLIEKNNKYSNELLEILENQEVDDFVRIKSAVVFIENMKRQHYSISEIKDKLNIDLLNQVYSKTKNLLSPEDVNVIHPFVAE